MKSLFNPLSIAITTVHWLVVAFALFGDIRELPWEPYHATPLLTQGLVFLNFLPLTIGTIICLPLQYILGQGIYFFSILSIVYIVCISFQWLFLGMLADRRTLTTRANITGHRCLYADSPGRSF
jgi:hypothetical protein